MGKKISLSSPLGIAITVAGLVLALSPQARSALRRWMVRGTATAMDAMEQVGGLTAGIVGRTTVGAGNHQSADMDLEVEPSIPPAPNSASTTAQTRDAEGSTE